MPCSTRRFIKTSAKTSAAWILMGSVLLVGACTRNDSVRILDVSNVATEAAADDAATAEQVIRISIGTQDQVINTAVGGATVRELELLEKHLPTDGKYANVEYDIQWSSYTSGPPITNKMATDQIDIGIMGDFPLVANLIKFQQEVQNADSIFIGTLAYSPTGAGNAVVVSPNSPAKSLADLKGQIISVPFGSAAHGMVLKALRDAGLNPETDVQLVSESPELGGSSLRTGQIAAHADFVPFGELFSFRGFARKIYDGAQTGVPTLHGIVVRSDFAQEHPELVVAYLKAVLEANQLFQENPEEIATQIESWSGIDKEVVYMFLGPSGLQLLDPTIRETQIKALENSLATLDSMGKLPDSVAPNQIGSWIDESYLNQAIAEMDLEYNQVVNAAETYRLAGIDGLTGEAIRNPNLAAQYWLQGDATVTNFASIANMLKSLAQEKAQGEAADVMFVHDRNRGWKLFAQNAYYVSAGGNVAAFLLAADADAYAIANGSKVMSFADIQVTVTP